MDLLCFLLVVGVNNRYCFKNVPNVKDKVFLTYDK